MEASETGDLLLARSVKPYRYNSEVKSLLKGKYPYLSQSKLQSLSPPDQASHDQWFRVIPPMTWFDVNVRMHLQAPPLDPAVARSCEKAHRQRLATSESKGSESDKMMSAFLNQVAGVTNSKPASAKQKSLMSKGFKEWVAQYKKSPRQTAPKLHKAFANHLKVMFVDEGKSDKETIAAITAAVNATRHKPDLKGKGDKKGEPPSACQKCKQTDRPWHWAKKCPNRDPRDASDVTCYNCQKKGHYANKCTSDKKPSPSKRKVNALKEKNAAAAAKKAKKGLKALTNTVESEDSESEEEDQSSASDSADGDGE